MLTSMPMMSFTVTLLLLLNDLLKITLEMKVPLVRILLPQVSLLPNAKHPQPPLLPLRGPLTWPPVREVSMLILPSVEADTLME